MIFTVFDHQDFDQRSIASTELEVCSYSRSILKTVLSKTKLTYKYDKTSEEESNPDTGYDRHILGTGHFSRIPQTVLVVTVADKNKMVHSNKCFSPCVVFSSNRFNF